MAHTLRRRSGKHPNPREAGDDGGIVVTAAIFMIGLAAIGGLALAGGSTYSGAQEGRRAADFGALAGAANLPTLNLGSRENPLGLPEPSQTDTPLGTVDTTTALPTLGEDFTLGTCAVVARQFGGGRSPITDSYATAPTTCSPTVSFSNPWLQVVADCLAGSIAAADCAVRVQQALTDRLPAPLAGSDVVVALEEATTAAGMTGTVVTAELMEELRTLNETLGGGLSPLIDELEALGGVHVDVARLAPALLTPHVSVEVTQYLDVPGAGLVDAGPLTLRQRSTARRTIKNAVLLPAIGPVGSDGTFTFDPNQPLDTVRELTLTALEDAADVVTPPADGAVHEVACAGWLDPCPSVSAALYDVFADVRDAVDPANGTPPTSETLINNAIAQGEPIMVATTSYIVDPSQTLDSSVYELPIVQQLLPGLLFVPAFDVVPAILSAGPLGQVFVTPLTTAETAGRTRGLYRARLVD